MESQAPVERAFFREHEGATVFFPWGLNHRGYRLTGSDDRKRAGRGVAFLVGGTVAIGVWGGHALHAAIRSEAAGVGEALHSLLGPTVAFALLAAGYALWAWHFVEHLQPSDLQVSRTERIREAAQLAEPWKLALLGVTLVAMGGLVAWLDLRVWWLGAAAAAMGLGFVWWSSVLQRARAG